MSYKVEVKEEAFIEGGEWGSNTFQNYSYFKYSQFPPIFLKANPCLPTGWFVSSKVGAMPLSSF